MTVYLVTLVKLNLEICRIVVPIKHEIILLTRHNAGASQSMEIDDRKNN